MHFKKTTNVNIATNNENGIINVTGNQVIASGSKGSKRIESDEGVTKELKPGTPEYFQSLGLTPEGR